MLFERVVAKSHEEITDEAILELEKEDPEMNQMDSDGSHSSSPQKVQKGDAIMSHQMVGRLDELMMRNSNSHPSQNE